MNASTFAVRTEDCFARFMRIRRQTLALCAGLSAEDLMVQSMPDASPGKWHLAHTTWFFEQFVLGRDPAYRSPNTAWHYQLNSYYQSVGPMHARPQRGLLSRPSLDEVRDYRARIDEAVGELIMRGVDDVLAARIELGLQHEQQHQELLLTDIKHAFWSQPLQPVYRQALHAETENVSVPMRFLPGREGVVEIGHGDSGRFAYDNETPRHRTWLSQHTLANRLVTNGEYLAFVRDGGYRDPALWLSDGWDTVQREGWQRPLYWQEDLSSEFTLSGMHALNANAPVCHVSYFEADAFARWAGARLPTEGEWENAAVAQQAAGNFQENQRFHPIAAHAGEGMQQMYGDVWEWTASPYVSYPGFNPLPGALGEYNGKFMNGQWVLRGGSCATPQDHIRVSYRNFFPPHARWQFAGIRLGQDR
ncbi:ergothioneine biosynthesis protein EgtB [Dyella caseinilytica]|uniref:Ergothioneine biosynthesis protein EgtB n=1 Tax=Dyella caseinilytica TaxID=1849581 RepID=A0ABX7GRU4_9GAMM|nr:ergothioneine biosynthesis protein EgtB [Dyella caseinilytica]QRN52542.1 ergothioneine biosynthesis protein EgtB [Dyella caseinilytica]GGA06873.1 ergothioneine biosynthesis protein EgtB [Dyella caseinilytica]